MASLQCVIANVSSGSLDVRMICHILGAKIKNIDTSFTITEIHLDIIYLPGMQNIA